MSRARWKGPAAWARREARAGDRLPYAHHLDDATLALRDGSLMRVIRVDGLPFETEDADQLDHMLAVRETMLRSVLDARFVVYHHVVRRRVAAGLDAAFPDPFSAAVDAAWGARLAATPLFVNEQFLTLVRRPARGKAGWLERLGRKARGSTADAPRALRDLESASAALLGALGGYGARPLGTVVQGGARWSEPLALLSALYNGEWRGVALPDGPTDLGHHIPYARVSFGLEAIETRRPHKRDDKKRETVFVDKSRDHKNPGRDFAAMISLKDYPDTTRAGMVDALLRLPCELVLTETFAPADRQIARERIDLALRRLKSADEDALAERAQMHAARDALGAGAAGFGDHHLTVMVRAGSLAALEGASAAAMNALADLGAIAVREDVNLEPAFWAQFPGNESYAVRRALISTANAAGFLSLHGFPLGQAQGNHWGQAITVFETTSATPFFFNFHRADLGNFTVIGPSGSGKTVVLNFLASQAQKVAPRMVLFDKDRGAEIFLRAMGAHYARLIPGEPTGFNPLALADSATNRAFQRDLVACLVQAETPAERARIADALDALHEGPPHLRRLRFLADHLAGQARPDPGDLASRLAPWVHDGPHAWLFDNAHDKLDIAARTLGFDMTRLLDLPLLRTPAMMYLFHRVEERLDGTPTMLLIDEGWKALDDEVFAARIRDWLKTLRKRNAIVGFATQSARDALDSRIASALVEQTATMIFTPNSRARWEDYGEGFGLSAHEVELIRALPAQSRCFLVRHANTSVLARLDLAGSPEVLTVLSGREASVRRLDDLRAELGDDPALWLPALTGVAWPGLVPSAELAEAAE